MKVVILFYFISLCTSVPVVNKTNHNSISAKTNLEQYIEKILSSYFDKYVQSNSKYSKMFEEAEKNEKMQSDAPSSDMIMDNVALKILLPIANKTTNFNSTILSFLNNTKTSNISYDLHKFRQRTKKNWIDVIKNNILHSTGRKNDSTGALSPELLEQVRNSLNRSVGVFPFGKIQEPANSTDENIEQTDYVEKVRSFYPSCEVPRNTDEEVWNDVNTMNLYFAVDYTGQANKEEPVNIASATLRLYKLPQDANATANAENCKDNSQYLSDEDKQIRVSVYWYSRSLKKHKDFVVPAIKRRLSDSKMLPLYTTNSYIELNIRPAVKSWVRGRNLGLAVVLEDVDGQILQADRHFRHLACHTVGNVSTPKPIPTLVIDALRGGLRLPVNHSHSASDVYGTSLPTLDICTYTLPPTPSPASTQSPGSSGEPCVTPVSTHRHIRHHRQHEGPLAADPRSRITSKRLVLTHSQLQEINEYFAKKEKR